MDTPKRKKQKMDTSDTEDYSFSNQRKSLGEENQEIRKKRKSIVRKFRSFITDTDIQGIEDFVKKKFNINTLRAKFGPQAPEATHGDEPFTHSPSYFSHEFKENPNFEIDYGGYGTSDFSGDRNDGEFDYYFFNGKGYSVYFGTYENFAYGSAYIEWTPLHLAAANDNDVVFMRLLDLGADLNVEDPLKNTPLIVAKKLNSNRVIFAYQHRISYPLIQNIQKNHDIFIKFV